MTLYIKNTKTTFTATEYNQMLNDAFDVFRY